MTKAEIVVKLEVKHNQHTRSDHLVMYYHNLIVVSRMIPVFQKEIMHYRSFINN